MNDQISGVVRHVGYHCGWCTDPTGPVLDESSAEAIVGGVIAIIGVAWSWRPRKNRQHDAAVYWIAVSVWLFPPVWWVWYFCCETDGT
jgi:hypothetical protein